MVKINLEQLQVAVLVSAAQQPLNQRLVAHEPDRQALALTQSWLPATGWLRVLGLGPLPPACQQTYYAQGIDNLLLSCLADEASQWADLCHQMATCDLVVCSARLDGSVNPQGLDGLLPYRLATAQQRQLVDHVVAVSVEADGVWVTQALAQGARRTLVLTEAAVLVMAASLNVTVQYAAYRAEQAPTVDTAKSMVVAEASIQVPFRRWLRPLRPRRQLSGHERLLAAIGGQTKQGGTTVVINTGTALEKSQQIIAYLKAQGVFHHLQGESNHERDAD